MKKKQIEQIPPLRPKFKDLNDFDYAAKARIVKVSGEKVLLLDVWHILEQEAVVRIATTKKEYGNYYFQDGIWDEKQCTNIFEMDDHITEGNTKVQNGEVLKKYGVKGTDLYYLSIYQRNIGQEKRLKEYARRRKALKERCKDMPKIPEVEDWVSGLTVNYLFYKRHGRYADIICSKCGASKTYATERKAGIDGMFEPVLDVPYRGMYTTCPVCGSKGIYEHMYRLDKTHIRIEFYVIQKFRKNGIVARLMEAEKTYKKDGERILYLEKARAFFIPGKKVQKDFHKYNPWTGEEFWDDCNLSGMNHICLPEAVIFPQSLDELQGTFLQYSGLKEYMEMAGKLNPIKYLEAYIRYPFLEMVTKSGMDMQVKRIINGEVGNLDTAKKTPDEIFKVRKEDVKRLVRKRGRNKFLNIIQTEKGMGIRIKPELEDEIANLIPSDEIRLVLQHMSAERFVNRVRKYAWELHMTQPDAALLYADYLSMRERSGYDLNNTIIAYPRDIRDAHDRMVLEINRERARAKIKDMNKRYPEIAEKYRKWDKKYHYTGEKFIVRPAKNAGEIIEEGRYLHHCVGGDRYLSAHNKGTGIILFLRKRKEKDTPYITIEICGTRIRQWYGMYDKKPDEEEVKDFLSGYLKQIKKRQEEG